MSHFPHNYASVLQMNALIRIIRSDVINNTANVTATFNNPFTSVDFKPISMTLSFRMLQLDFVFGDTQFPLFSPDFL